MGLELIGFGLVAILLICFGAVLLIGPPYLPTLTPQVKIALDMLDLKPGQTMLELGCGDGKVLVAAARRGWKVVGIEINPLLVVVCVVRTWRYRHLVTVRWGSYWNLKLWPPETTGIFGFVLPRFMVKLDESIVSWKASMSRTLDNKKVVQSNPITLASFAFKIPDRKIMKEEQGVFLYEY